MSRRTHHQRPANTLSATPARRWVWPMVLVAVMLIRPAVLAAQAHEHAVETPTRDARLELVLGGPHLILYHGGYLALGETQIAGLQQLRGTVCEAELVYVERAERWRNQLTNLLGDSAPLPPQETRVAASRSALQDAMSSMANAESEWLDALMHARRDALALLSPSQRAQLSALREHWAREAAVMIEDATRPGQRGHPGTQIPIRVPGMVVGATTLLPYCEALHGPSLHISMPPPH